MCRKPCLSPVSLPLQSPVIIQTEGPVRLDHYNSKYKISTRRKISAKREKVTTDKIKTKGCLKNNSVWRENVPTRGEGVHKNFKNFLHKIPFYLGTFLRGGGGHFSFPNIFFVDL